MTIVPLPDSELALMDPAYGPYSPAVIISLQSDTSVRNE
jgi:hypothetical protein